MVTANPISFVSCVSCATPTAVGHGWGPTLRW